MTDQDIPEFTVTLMRAAEIFGEPCSEGRVVAYFDALSDLPIAWVVEGLRDCERFHRFFPKPAEIRERAQTHDGHLEPEQAWALVARLSEDDSVVWTEEIAQAYGIAQHVGDRIGGRMAFLEAYRSKLLQARKAGQPAHWWPSLGYEPSGRADAIRAAVEAGRLPSRMLPPSGPPRMLEA